MSGKPWRDLGDCADNVHSQTGEDGILAALFDHVGTTNRYLVDVGAGDGVELSNTRRLLEQGWRGARFDASPDGAGVPGAAAPAAAPAGDVHQELITAENVGDVLSKYNVPCDFDLLSLDIDGVDWWVLRALLRGGYRPRVVVCEVNPCIPADPPVAVEYDPAFAFSGCDYFGASLGAFRRLAEAHGYRLVHVQGGFNAFFALRDLVPADAVIEIDFAPQPFWPPDPRRRPWHLVDVEDLR